MGVIRRIYRLFIGPGVGKILDMTNTCRCVECCSRELGWQPCEIKTANGKPICDWCLGSIAGKYPHCHGIGNSVLRAGWRLEGPKQ